METAVQMVLQNFLNSKSALYVCSSVIIFMWWRSRSKRSQQKGSSLRRKSDCEKFEKDIDVKTGYSQTLLMEIYEAAYRSAEEYYADRCLELIQIYPKYINISLRGCQSTPFLAACRAGNSGLVKYMLQCGANIQSRTSAGESPLYLAAYSAVQNPRAWDPTLLNELFLAGCELMPQKMRGYYRDQREMPVPDYSPLHLAASYGHTQLVRWLILHGGDPEAPTEGGETPFQLARYNGHMEVAKLLSLHIGDRWETRKFLLEMNRSQ